MSTVQRTGIRGRRISARPVAATLVAAEPYRWALNPLQPFGALLRIANQLAHTAPSPIDAVTGDPATNLYLIVCGLDQILSDYLHRHFYRFDHPRFPRPVRKELVWASGVEHSLRRAAVEIAGRGLIQTEEELSRLSRSIGGSVLDGRPTPNSFDALAISRLAGGRFPTGLRRSRLKLPQSFRGVDLYPEDCELIARRFFELTSGDQSPVAVVGLRTAGLYMAPLCAATLDRLGHPRVELLSLRPGAPTLGAEERRLRAIAGAGGWAFVVDDPTWRASAFEKTCETLKRHGFPAHRIWLTACEIGNQPALRPGTADATDTPPEKKVWRGFEAAQKVVLKKTEWQIHAHLANDSAERYLNRPQALARLGARHVTVIKGHPFSETGEPPAVTGLAPGSRQRRFHVQKVYEIEVESDSGRHIELVVGRGVGVGFFGYHSYLVAHHLDGLIPDVLAFENGVLFTRWERAGRIEPGTPGSPDMEVVAQYIARRANQLHLEPSSAPARETRAVYSGARQVARLLGASMGGVGSLAQFRAAHALSSHLGPARPASIDARMGPAEWVRNGRGDLVKVDFEEHGVDITDRRVNDPVHDVAAASIAFRLDAESEKRLVETYAQSTGDRDRLRARLAFHKLMAGGAELEAIHFEDQPASRWLREEFARRLVATEQALTRTVNGFLATAYLSDVNSREGGDVWALDLDDTLETDWLGFETTSPAGARALRRLAAHDQLVLTSTGRSLEEVRDRCETYRIAGGIAEYGSVAWDARHQRQLVIVSEESQLALERLREAILAETDILVDPRYRHSLRLFRFTPDGRRGMNVDEVTAVIERHAIQGLDVVEGYRKSVVYAAGTDKSHALAPLLTSLGVDRHARRLHVVGDEFTDLGLLALADCRHAPGNASAALRARSAEMSMFIAKRGRGAGVSQAVNRQLHAWGRGCALCRQADLDQADRVLVDVLGVQDRSRLGRFAYALHPASIRAFEL